MGIIIQSTLSVDTTKSTQVNLQDALKEDISKKALDVIALSSETWVKAYNAGDPSQMKSINPDSSYYKDIAGRMTKPADVKVHLLKVAVNPESLNIRGDSITLNASEMYQYDASPATQSPQPSTATGPIRYSKFQVKMSGGLRIIHPVGLARMCSWLRRTM